MTNDEFNRRPSVISLALPIRHSDFVIHFQWGVQDSNLRRHKPSDLQSDPFDRFGNSPCHEQLVSSRHAEDRRAATHSSSPTVDIAIDDSQKRVR